MRDVTIKDIPGVYKFLRQIAEKDAEDCFYIGDFSNRGLQNHLIANAKKRAAKRGLYFDAYILYIAYFIESWTYKHPTITSEDNLTDGTFAPIVDAE